MHIMEGFLPLEWCIFWFVLCIPVLYMGLRNLRNIFEQHPEQKILVAVSGAFIFVLSSFKLPSVTGSSSHPTGTGFSTIMYGVGITAILASIVLVFQALLLAHGGLTTLGANIFSMGIAGPACAYLAYKVLNKTSKNRLLNIGIAVALADLITYVVTSLQLALAFPSDGSVMTSFMTFMAVFAITQIPLAIVEGILLTMFVDYVTQNRPDLFARTPLEVPSS